MRYKYLSGPFKLQTIKQVFVVQHLSGMTEEYNNRNKNRNTSKLNVKNAYVCNNKNNKLQFGYYGITKK